MEKKRILVVDDSALIRKLVTLALEKEPDIEVVIAPNGPVALEKIARLKPDLVVLDVEMPDMDGLETLARIHSMDAKLPVVMFSALTESGSKIAMEAMARGAADCVLKPSQTGSLGLSMEYVRENLMTKVRGLCKIPDAARTGWVPVKSAVVPVGPAFPHAAQPATALSSHAAQAHVIGKSGGPPQAGHAAASAPHAPIGAGHASDPGLRAHSAAPAQATPSQFPPRIPGIIELLVIGVSTGGPNALAAVVPAFTRDFPVPVLIVQHMPPMFTRLLAERLGALCGLESKEAVDGEVVGPGQLRVAPGNFHMTVTRAEKGFALALNQDPPENSCRPAVDVLFRSAAACSKNRLLAAVLTGMGQDGMLGAERIKAEGGLVLAQDEATSVVWGMPGAVVHAGLADAVLPLPDIGHDISRRARGMRG